MALCLGCQYDTVFSIFGIAAGTLDLLPSASKLGTSVDLVVLGAVALTYMQYRETGTH